MHTIDKIISINSIDITAIGMTISATDCDEPCNATITVTWQNTYHAPKKFRPGITVNGVLTRLSEIRLDTNEIVTKTFNLTNLMEGTYNICPNPN